MDKFLQSATLWALVLTAGTYSLGLWLQKKTRSPLVQPILLSAALVIPFLLVTGTSNAAYQGAMASVSWLMTPCTVCLGINLYTQLGKLRGNLRAIFAGIAAGTAVSLLSVWGLCAAFGLDRVLTVSLLPKSVTSAMAQPLAESAGGLGSLAVAAVVTTGILGAIVGPGLCRLLGITDPISQGVAYGTAAHIMGTSKASQLGPVQGAVSSLSLVVAGLLTALVFSFLA